MIKIIFTILLLNITSMYFALGCKDLDEDSLIKLYSKYQILYRENKLQLLVINDDLISKRSVFENSECKWAPHHQSLCPWQYIHKYRKDKFPRYLLEAKCTCKKCNLEKHLNSGDYGCIPVYESSLVLVKRNCGLDGFYKWMPAVEKINMACVCGIN